MDKNRKCPICGGEFEEGGITLAHGGVSWVTKEEHASLLSKLVTPVGGNIKAYKCKNCGYLESYAK